MSEEKVEHGVLELCLFLLVPPVGPSGTFSNFMKHKKPLVFIIRGGLTFGLLSSVFLEFLSHSRAPPLEAHSSTSDISLLTHHTDLLSPH